VSGCKTEGKEHNELGKFVLHFSDPPLLLMTRWNLSNKCSQLRPVTLRSGRIW
jgi:hypothetical protein